MGLSAGRSTIVLSAQGALQVAQSIHFNLLLLQFSRRPTGVLGTSPAYIRHGPRVCAQSGSKHFWGLILLSLVKWSVWQMIRSTKLGTASVLRSLNNQQKLCSPLRQGRSPGQMYSTIRGGRDYCSACLGQQPPCSTNRPALVQCSWRHRTVLAVHAADCPSDLQNKLEPGY